MSVLFPTIVITGFGFCLGHNTSNQLDEILLSQWYVLFRQSMCFPKAGQVLFKTCFHCSLFLSDFAVNVSSSYDVGFNHYTSFWWSKCCWHLERQFSKRLSQISDDPQLRKWEVCLNRRTKSISYRRFVKISGKCFPEHLKLLKCLQ